MNAENIVAVSAAVTALTQLVKWAGLPDKWGPIAVLLLSALGVAVWAWSKNTGVDLRTGAWDYFTAWISVALAAAGIYGFTRAAASTVTTIRTPPGGAGQSPTISE